MFKQALFDFYKCQNVILIAFQNKGFNDGEIGNWTSHYHLSNFTFPLNLSVHSRPVYQRLATKTHYSIPVLVDHGSPPQGHGSLKSGVFN